MRWLGIWMMMVGCGQGDEAGFEVVRVVEPDCLTGIEKGVGVDYELAGTAEGDETRVLSMRLRNGSDVLLYCTPPETSWDAFHCDPLRTEGFVEEWSVLELGNSELEVSIDRYRAEVYDDGGAPICGGWFSAWTRERVEEQTLEDLSAVGSIVAFGPPAAAYLLAAELGSGYSAIGGM